MSDNTPQDEYKPRPGQSEVVSDSSKNQHPIDSNTAKVDEQLARDDFDAIDKSNIIDERTRGAAPDEGYREPGDDEGLPSDDGTSSKTR